MENKIQKSLDEVIEKDINYLSTLAIGSEERSKMISELEKLHALRVEEIKAENDRYSKKCQNDNERLSRMVEVESNNEQLKAQNMDRLFNAGLQLGLTIGGWIMFSVWQKREQRFEMTGTPSTPMFRNLLSSMTPKLKR